VKVFDLAPPVTQTELLGDFDVEDMKGASIMKVEEMVRCWRLGLIVSELITNAVRHAFDGVGGNIRVEIFSSRSFVECRVSDNGRAVKPIRAGRGLRIVEALAGTLGGTIDYVIGEHGSAAVLVFPAGTSARKGATSPSFQSPRRNEHEGARRLA
jgi:two-component sensor histidine kinase